MKEYQANRLSGGNRLFPAEIKIDDFGVTLKIPGVFSGKEKSLAFHQISSIKIDSPLVGFSKITFDTIGWDRVVAEGFEKADAIEIKEVVQRGISGIRSGNSNNSGNYSSPQVVIQQAAKTAEEILAEAEAEKVRHQIEMEKKAATAQSDKEFYDSIKKNWKAIVAVAVVAIIGFGIYSYINNNAKQEDAKLSQQLEQIEDKVKLAIQSGEKEKALDLANQLIHPSHKDIESQKFDAFIGYKKYDEYWSNKREEYKAQIMNLTKTTIPEKPSNNQVQENKTEEQVTESVIPEEQQSTVNESAAKLIDNGNATVFNDKSYFYSDADLATKRNGYLIKGQNVKFTSRNGDFIFCKYTNDKGKVTEGWMLASDFTNFSN